ncbi:MAG: dihydrofolate reductase [Candidatus Saccharibacteria bacterium]
MIYAIAAVDEKMGLATARGIPWDLPTDKAYFRDKTIGHPVLMGYNMYSEFAEPLPNRRNLVIVRPNTKLEAGFEPIEDITDLLKTYQDSNNTLWIVGGAAVYAKLLPVTQKIYLTRIAGDFECTKFFPKFENKFKLTFQEPSQAENGMNFNFEVWDQEPGTNS